MPPPPRRPTLSPGYREGAPGAKTTADEFARVLDGLAANNLLAGINHVLTGACLLFLPFFRGG